MTRRIGPLTVGADMLLPLTYDELDILWAHLHSGRCKQRAVYGYCDLGNETSALQEDTLTRWDMSA